MKPLPLFVPVIHVKDDAQACEQAGIAFENGADGIFLIDHARAAGYLTRSYREVRWLFPDRWIGLNYLGLHPGQALLIFPDGADALWLDSVQGLSGSVREIDRPYQVFAPAGFKYQPQATDPMAEAREIAGRFDVTCTSGPGTGMAAGVEKIQAMKGAIGDRPLALASGVTVENVLEYLPFVSCFMVATSLCSSFHELVPERVRAMSDRIESARGGVPLGSAG